MDNMTLTCPRCGNLADAYGKPGMWVVCKKCGEMIPRGNRAQSMEGINTRMPLPTCSPLCIDTRGTYSGDQFTLQGRVQLFFGEQYINLWYSAAGSTYSKWLAEAYGTFGMYSVLENHKYDNQSFSQAVLGSVIRIGNEEFVVSTSAPIREIRAEGYLPQLPAFNSVAVVLNGLTDSQALMFISRSTERPYILTGKELPFASWKFEQRVLLNDWSL